MKLLKTLSKLCSNHMVIFTVLAALVLIYFINMYSGKKSLIQSAMSGLEGNNNAVKNSGESEVLTSGNVAAPAAPLGQNSGPAGVSGLKTDMQGLPPSCTDKKQTDPKHLLPKDNNTEFSQKNPNTPGDIGNVSLLNAGYHIGIDTVGQSLRNANLQLRSEPANPQLDVGPWNNATIGPDLTRRPMEIGCGGN